MKITFSSILLVILTTLSAASALAQDPRVTGDQDGSSQQVEESDEAYRRRMELEDARRANPTYTDPVDSYQRELEKIDKLPEESRENIRDQLIDVIMENNDWQPGDALEEYPYEPTAAAQADADLMKQEQEAWDEQIEKYHAREAEAFGAYRGPPGAGNPDGQEGGSEGGEGGQQGQEGGEGGEGGGQGQEGGEGGQGQEGSNGSAGTYQPQNNNSEDGDSTAGVSESALDFLMGRRAGSQQGQQQQGQQQQGQQQQGQQQQGQQQQDQQQQDQQQQDQQQQDQQQQDQQQQDQDQQQDQSQPQDQSEPAEDSEQETEPDMRGIIAIEDLDKLEGTRMVPVKPPEEEPDPDDP